MSAANIQAEIKSALAEVHKELGSESDPLTYLEKKTVTGGSSPLDPETITVEDVLLLNAVLDDVSRDMIDGTLIKQGDSSLTCDNDVEIKQGDIIKRGSSKYFVVTVVETNPTGSVLLYEPVVRLQ